jgi:phage terminase large subunit-like protein
MLARGGMFIAVATRKHHDDAYSYMLNSPSYQVIESPAIIRWPESHAPIMEKRAGKEVLVGVEVVGDSEVLWPEVRPIEYLLKERYSMGPLLFEREFQNSVRSEEDALFRTEWIEDALDDSYSFYGLPPGEFKLTQGWDLALCTDPTKAKDGDRDWSVGTTLARRESDGRFFVASIVRFRGKTPDEVRREVEAEYLRYKDTPPTTVAIEKNNFGALHLLTIQQESSLAMPLVGHETTKRKKVEGLPALAAAFETHRLALPNRGRGKALINELLGELTGYGIVKHDDMVLSLLIAYQAFARACTSESYVVDLFDDFDESSEEISDGQEESDDEYTSTLWESIRDWE